MSRSSYVQGVPFPTDFHQYLAEQRQGLNHHSAPQVVFDSLQTAIESQQLAHVAYEPFGLTRVQLPAEVLQQPPFKNFIGKPAFFDSGRNVYWDGHNVFAYQNVPPLKTAMETEPSAAGVGLHVPHHYPADSPFYVEAPSVYVLKQFS